MSKMIEKCKKSEKNVTKIWQNDYNSRIDKEIKSKKLSTNEGPFSRKHSVKFDLIYIKWYNKQYVFITNRLNCFKWY